MINLEDALKIVIVEVRRLKVLETRVVSQYEVVEEAEDVEVHVDVDEEEVVVEDAVEDAVDNM
jgi:rRNA processing protein Krr1/Pno1